MMKNDLRVNVGCGQTPTSDWLNFDNSLSIHLVKTSIFPQFLYSLKLLNQPQHDFIKFARMNNVEYGDVTKKLPLPDNSCEVIYSSHMIEHLDKVEVSNYLKEAYRVLRPGGIIRTVVPDIKKKVKEYNKSGNADAFIESTLLCEPKPKSLFQKMKFLLVGARHHQWMYDGESLSQVLKYHQFIDVTIQPPGETNISNPGDLDLSERSSESVYVEARKPDRN